MSGVLHRWLGDDWGMRSLDGHAAPSSAENRRALARLAIGMAGGFLALGAVVLAIVAIDGSRPEGLHLVRAVVICGAGLVVAVPASWVAFLRLPPPLLHLLPPVATGMVFLIGTSLGSFGTEAVAVGLVIVTIEVALSTTRAAMLFHLTHLGAAYALLTAIEPGYPVPVARVIGVYGGVLLAGLTVGRLVDRMKELSHSQRAANAAAEAARSELAELNRTLESRVAEQVAELERLGELERFLPSAVVDAVVSDSRDLLEPHRAEIAVLFCDLRGFTAFASGAQPEEVHELLDAYFALLGEHAQRHHATVGAFTGDGLMAFFGDPVPVEDPAARALAMARELQGPVECLLARWRKVGHEVSFGVGIALGYANVGMIGFEGRRDYTALGPVVNLAARLCAEATQGGILLDPRAAVAVEDTDVELDEPITLHLKGFDRTIEAFPVRQPGRVERLSCLRLVAR